MMPHSRNTSYQGSTGTPLSQIPERAIHAQPFHPHYAQATHGQEFYPQQYPVMQTPQHGFYYPQQQYAGSMASMTSPAPAFVQQIPAQMQPQMPQEAYMSPAPAPVAVQAQIMSPEQQPGVVTQEVNGMFYYYDASQIPAVAAFPAFVPATPQQQEQQMMQPYPVHQLQGQQMMASPAPDMMAGMYYGQGQMGQQQMMGGGYYAQ